VSDASNALAALEAKYLEVVAAQTAWFAAKQVVDQANQDRGAAHLAVQAAESDLSSCLANQESIRSQILDLQNRLAALSVEEQPLRGAVVNATQDLSNKDGDVSRAVAGLAAAQAVLDQLAPQIEQAKAAVVAELNSDYPVQP